MGMAGAFDEAVTTGMQRKRTAMEILADLLRAFESLEPLAQRVACDAQFPLQIPFNGQV